LQAKKVSLGEAADGDPAPRDAPNTPETPAFGPLADEKAQAVSHALAREEAPQQESMEEPVV